MSSRPLPRAGARQWASSLTIFVRAQPLFCIVVRQKPTADSNCHPLSEHSHASHSPVQPCHTFPRTTPHEADELATL